MYLYIAIIGFIMAVSTSASATEQSQPSNDNLSHERYASSFEEAKARLVSKIQKQTDIPRLPPEKQLEVLEELAAFDFGKFLIETGGLNGYWTHYVVKHPEEGRLTRLDKNGMPFTTMEEFILDEAPFAIATQERFSIFKREIQKRIQEGCAFASIPCGVMADLLDLDYSLVKQFDLYGVDLDPQSLSLAKEYAEQKGLLSHCHFLNRNAWQVVLNKEMDLIATNGLTIYEKDDDKVTELYKAFYSSLKPGGVLVCSFLNELAAWKKSEINMPAAMIQGIIFQIILDSKWQAFRSEKQVISQLQEAGFTNIEVLYDSAHVFPTVIATKE